MIIFHYDPCHTHRIHYDDNNKNYKLFIKIATTDTIKQNIMHNYYIVNDDDENNNIFIPC